MVNCDAVPLGVQKKTLFAYPIEARQNTIQALQIPINILKNIREFSFRARLSYIRPNANHNQTRKRTPPQNISGLAAYRATVRYKGHGSIVRVMDIYKWTRRTDKLVNSVIHNDTEIGGWKSRM